MKKLYLSTMSLITALGCLGGGALTGYAEATAITCGTLDTEAEELLLGDADDFSLELNQSTRILASDSDEYLYRDFLDENNLAVYDALSVWVTPSEDVITVSLPETVSITLSALPGSEDYTTEDAEIFRNAIFGSSKSGIDSLFFDTPEIFWIDTGNLSIGVENATYSYNRFTGDYTLSIEALKFTPQIFDSYESLEDALLYKEKLETAVENYEISGETRYEQLKSIHDSIAYFTYYDLEGAYYSSAVGSIVEPGVVCEGYSKGLKILCDRIGIPCVLVFGNYDPVESVAHMWNYVKMEDGKWYGIDLTWDDTDGSNGVEVKYSYFMKGSDSFFTNHTEEPDFSGTIFTYPEISITDYDPENTQPITTTTTIPTTTTTKATTTTTATPTTTTTKATTTTTATPTTTTTKATTTTTATPTTTTTKATTTTTAAPTTTTTKATTTTTAAPTTTTTKATTTTTVAPTTTTTKATTTTTSAPTTTSTTITTVTTTVTTVTETPVTTTTTPPETVYDKGDFNRDGEVNVADLVLCAQTVLGETSCNCDFNDDGFTDSFDLVGMRIYLITKIFE